jgi:hypothetical protein
VSRSTVMAALLLIGTDVGENFAGLQGFDEARHEGVKLVRAFPLQSVLVLRITSPAACANVLHRLQKKMGAWYLGELAAQPKSERSESADELIVQLLKDLYVSTSGANPSGTATTNAVAGTATQVPSPPSPGSLVRRRKHPPASRA